MGALHHVRQGVFIHLQRILPHCIVFTFSRSFNRNKKKLFESELCAFQELPDTLVRKELLMEFGIGRSCRPNKTLNNILSTGHPQTGGSDCLSIHGCRWCWSVCRTVELLCWSVRTVVRPASVGFVRAPSTHRVPPSPVTM